MEIWIGFIALLIAGAILYFVLKYIWSLKIKQAIIATVIVTVVINIITALSSPNFTAEISFGVFVFVATAIGVVQISKLLWGKGVPQKILAATTVSVLSGVCLYLVTGDADFGTKGGLAMTGVAALAMMSSG